MLRLLIRLWWKQQRRNFSWKDAVVAGYIVMLYVALGVSFYLSFTERGEQLFEGEGLTAVVGLSMVVGMLVPDIFLKIVMKRDITAMDDYVKSRPVPEKTWDRFLLLTNVVSFWNYVLPVLTLPIFLLLLPSASQAFGCSLLFWLFSCIDGIYVTCWRKTTKWMLRWPLALGWMGMLFVLAGYLVVASFLVAWLAYLGMLLLAAAVFAGLVVYLRNLKVYNEQKRKTSRFRGFKGVNLFSLQYIGMMRAKRIRNMVLMVTAVFLFDAYMFALLPSEASDDLLGKTPMVSLYVVGAILLPSAVLSQWTFGIEANFFQGLLTKPVKVEEMLRNCFYYYVLVSGMALLLVVPVLLLDVGVGVLVLVGGFCQAVFINLFNMPTCLFSSRLEIFSSSMFNMQGANLKINLYAIAFLVPLGMINAIYCFFGETVWCVACVLLALVAVLLHKWFIGKVAALFYKNRYKRMEKFMK